MAELGPGGVYTFGTARKDTGKAVDEQSELETGGVYTFGKGQSVPVRVTEPIPEKPGLLSRAYTGVKEAFTGGEAGEAVEEIPELINRLNREGITTGDAVRDSKVIGSLLLSSNVEAQKDVIREQFGDEVKIKDDEHGTTILEFKGGEQAVLNKPGMSVQDINRTGMDMVMFLGPGKMAGLGRGLLAKMGIGALAGGATEAARQKGLQTLGSKQEVSPKDVILAGATEMVGEVIPVGLRALKIAKKARQAKKAGVLKEELGGIAGRVEEGQEAAEALGVGLTQAQQTMAPSALRKQAALQMLDGSSMKALETLKKQDEQFGEAVETVLSEIAPAKTIDQAPLMIKEASEKAINKKLGHRKKAASKWYQKAFQNKEPVELSETWKKIDDVKSQFEPETPTYKTMERVEKMLNRGAERASNIEKRHTSKETIDSMFKNFGDSSVDQRAKKALTEVKNGLVADLKKANKNYDKARKIFSSESPAVEKIQKSYLGEFAAIDDANIDKLDQVAKKIFKPRTTDMQVRELKRIIKKESPEAWNAIVRRKIEDSIAKKGYENPGSLHTALFANNAQRKQLYAGLDGDIKKRFRYLETIAERAKSGYFRGTDTAFKQQDIIDIDKGMMSVIGGAFTPLDSMKNFINGLDKMERRAIISDIMFNTGHEELWKQIRKSKPGSKLQQRIFMKIAKKAAREYGKPALQALRTKDQTKRTAKEEK